MSEVSGAAAPYPGLRPFGLNEADIFFGREAHTDRLLDILQRERFLAVIGPSGCGKSSLVRAGLLPSLQMGTLGSGSDWRIAVMRPGDAPIARLVQVLIEASGMDGAEGAGDVAARDVAVALLEAELRRGPLGLVHAVTRVRSSPEAALPGNLLIVVDQFEEIFTYAEAGGSSADESDAFVNLLLTARAAACRIHVVLTMRTDFLGDCVRFADLPDAINRAQYLTPRLSRVEFEAAVSGPAEVFGGSVDPTLVTELINAVGQNSDQLPLLQHALSRMWTRATERDPGRPRIEWADEDAVGGVAGALNQHADRILTDVLTAAADRDKELARVAGLFMAITERRSASAGGQLVRRPQTLQRIAASMGVETAALEPIVSAFAAPGVSLLQYGTRLNPQSVIDLSHEALIRQWTRLAGWVDVEARRAAEYQRFAERADDHRHQRGNLLDGTALARAIDWLKTDPKVDVPGWQPTAAWAARYAISDAPDEFARTVAFIEESDAAVRARAEEESERVEQRRLAVVQRAELAERAAADAKRRTKIAAAAAVVILASAVVAGYFAYEASRASALLRTAVGRAQDAERKAYAAERQATGNAVLALEESMRAEERASELKVLNATLDQKTLQLEAATKQLAAQVEIASSAPATDLTENTTAPGPDVPPPPPPAAGGDARRLTVEDLAVIMPRSREDRRRATVEPLNRAMAEFDIDTPLRQAHFVAQVGYETASLLYLEEIADGSRYEGRVDLGNTEPGDGRKYKGRGMIAIVGRANYRRFGEALGVDLLNYPERAAEPDVAARIAAAYWKLRSINARADEDDVKAVTKVINGGFNGLDDRMEYLLRAKQRFGLQTPAP